MPQMPDCPGYQMFPGFETCFPLAMYDVSVGSRTFRVRTFLPSFSAFETLKVKGRKPPLWEPRLCPFRLTSQ